MFALMQKEELIHNAEDWIYKVAKNREALQEGGTLRYSSCVMQLALKIFYRYLSQIFKNSDDFIMLIKMGWIKDN